MKNEVPSQAGGIVVVNFPFNIMKESCPLVHPGVYIDQ